MNKNHPKGLHLVTAEEAVTIAQQPLPEGRPDESDSFVAVLVRYYRELKEELEGLCDEQDQERIIALRAKRKAVRRCLAAYGVRLGA